MRTLGANPRDLSALITAGELSLKLGDVTAAAALLKRAEEIDPMNGRVKAGMARILVHEERPGEALRFFDQAAGYGLDPGSFAGDRGLAYDLIGEQDRAQRDYRLALKANDDAEVQRRYALSLGISGKREAALAEIDSLLRKSDRGAWRARAFILAMGGDVTGAEKIATTMMPPGMAAGLQPFFQKLPTLPAVDRAFAVHFGEVRATPQRLADARLAPTLPALPPEVRAPTVLAAATPPPAQPKRAQSRSRKRDRKAASLDRIEVAAVAPKATPTLPPPPRYGNGVTFAAPRERVQRLPPQATAPVAAPTQVAAISQAPATTPTAETSPALAVARAASRPLPFAERFPYAVPPVTPKTAVRQAPVGAPAATQVAALPPAASVVPAPVAVALRQTPVATPAPTRVTTSAPTQVAALSSSASAPVAGPMPEAPAATPAAIVPSAIVAPAPSPAAAQVVSTSTPTPTPVPAVAAAPIAHVAATTPVPPRLSEDSILARIIAGISIPASELGVEPARPAPAPASAPVVAAELVAASKPAPVKEPTPPAPVAIAKTPTPKPTPTPDPKVAAKKALADKKAAAEKKLADAKKAADAKQAADEKKAAKADPARIWVQVSGGANEGDLPKAWAATKARASALSGRSGYSTPLRATNRVLTGPFKTDAEARAFVNQLAKQGVSAFPFTSDAGQKITKLPAK